MKNLNTIMFAGVFVSAMFAAPFASAHAKLTDSDPKSGTTLDTAPKEIALTFNEKIEQSFSSMSVIDSDGKEVSAEKAKVDVANAAVLRLSLAQMHAGAYTVKWAVAGHDGHRRTGDFTFSVK
jgi:methionine-rich copper-binding protein CopC